MYKKSYFIALLISFLLSFSLINRNVDAQLDLNKLTDKKSEFKQQKVEKEYIFNYIKDQILSNVPYPKLDISLGGKQIRSLCVISIILKDEYQVELSCEGRIISPEREIISSCSGVMVALVAYYHTKHSSFTNEKYKTSVVEIKKRDLTRSLEGLKKTVSQHKRADDLPKIMKFIDDYNQLLASTYEERESLRKKKFAKKEQKASEAKLQAERAVKAKIDPIIKYVMTNRTKLEKESKLFRKNVSKVWYTEGDLFIIDLLSSNKIITVGNNKPVSVQIGKYDKDSNYIIVYVTKDGKIVVDKDGKLTGIAIRMIMISHKKFKLGISMTDGIEVGPETMLSFVRNLK